MKQALILHGTNATPDMNWFRWLESTLRDDGYSVWLPQLPNAATPNAQTYTTFLLNNPDFVFNKETIIIGHSSGAVEILSLLQHLPQTRVVGDVYLVSAFKDNLDWDALDGLFLEPFDFELIRHKAKSITLIHSDNDPYVTLEHARYLSERLDAKLEVIPGQGHFNLEQSANYKEFPKLLKIMRIET